MKKVEVRLYASLRKYQANPGTGEALVVQLNGGAKLRDLLSELKIPEEEVAIAMVNDGRARWLDFRNEKEGCILQNRDRIALFPHIAGG